MSVKNEALLARLHQHQEGVLSILRGAEPMLRDPKLRDTGALARARWALMRGLTAYQLFKHAEFFDPIIRGGAPGEIGRAEQMKRACSNMGEEFRSYVAKWSGTDVAGEWASYQPAALAMIARLREHVSAERRNLATLLDRAA